MKVIFLALRAVKLHLTNVVYFCLVFSRREFLQAAAVFGSSSALTGSLSESILRAAAIDPNPGTTFMDADHIVVLMQENRSFDHAFGALRGVRGFRDPRPPLAADGDPVWFQKGEDGKVVPPFRLKMDDTNVTWIGGTPHSWRDQVDARNNGRYDKWLTAKARRDKFPMTMGFFNREDIPFYYDLADAFTICDYAFCSSLTGTTPNRLYLWSGTIRENAQEPARVQNGDTNYEKEASWTTYPERLEKAGVSWKIYQNEVSLDSGFVGEQDAWLSNFTDNPIEWFSQYRVRFSATRRARAAALISEFGGTIGDLESRIATLAGAELEKAQKDLESAKARLQALKLEQAVYTEEAWQSLAPADKAIHEKAFCDNRIDPNYRSLVEHTYDDKGQVRKMMVPAGDVLAQFRKDVKDGSLPSVSWLVAPEKFSDHPGSAWFGAWYLSEAINILTDNPEVWKKTIFVLCYDENDGFFDHIPPFIAPHPDRPETGKVSANIDAAAEISKEHGRDHSIGLGYRCPLVIASPWSRGGCVNSQICDHTSVLQLMEKWLAGKGIPVIEPNISRWRRTVCGDLTSVFRPYKGEKIDLPKFVEKTENLERIHKASFTPRPDSPAGIDPADVENFDLKSLQEEGTRPSCPLPYELEASIELTAEGALIKVLAGRKRFGDKSAGGAFNTYSFGADFACRAYAVTPGDSLTDLIPVSEPAHLRIDGPNGFLRELKAGKQPGFIAKVTTDKNEVVLTLKNVSERELAIDLSDPSYGAVLKPVKLKSNETKVIRHKAAMSQGWYDLLASHNGAAYRFSGRIEDGSWSISDPAMA